MGAGSGPGRWPLARGCPPPSTPAAPSGHLGIPCLVHWHRPALQVGTNASLKKAAPPKTMPGWGGRGRPFQGKKTAGNSWILAPPVLTVNRPVFLAALRCR